MRSTQRSSVTPVWIGVSIAPGQIAFTRMPDSASSSAADRVRARGAAWQARETGGPWAPARAETHAVWGVAQERGCCGGREAARMPRNTLLWITPQAYSRSVFLG